MIVANFKFLLFCLESWSMINPYFLERATQSVEFFSCRRACRHMFVSSWHEQPDGCCRGSVAVPCARRGALRAVGASQAAPFFIPAGTRLTLAASVADGKGATAGVRAAGSVGMPRQAASLWLCSSVIARWPSCSLRRDVRDNVL